MWESFPASQGFRCPEHISGPKNPASKLISAFYWVFCPFSGIENRPTHASHPYIVVVSEGSAIRSTARAEQVCQRVTGNRSTTDGTEVLQRAARSWVCLS